jgi:hypothetical protein
VCAKHPAPFLTTLVAQTNLSAFGHSGLACPGTGTREFTVIRRYKDFEWLHARLEEVIASFDSWTVKTQRAPPGIPRVDHPATPRKGDARPVLPGIRRASAPRFGTLLESHSRSQGAVRMRYRVVRVAYTKADMFCACIELEEHFKLFLEADGQEFQTTKVGVVCAPSDGYAAHCTNAFLLQSAAKGAGASSFGGGVLKILSDTVQRGGRKLQSMSTR